MVYHGGHGHTLAAIVTLGALAQRVRAQEALARLLPLVAIAALGGRLTLLLDLLPYCPCVEWTATDGAQRPASRVGAWTERGVGHEEESRLTARQSLCTTRRGGKANSEESRKPESVGCRASGIPRRTGLSGQAGGSLLSPAGFAGLVVIALMPACCTALHPVLLGYTALLGRDPTPPGFELQGAAQSPSNLLEPHVPDPEAAVPAVAVVHRPLDAEQPGTQNVVRQPFLVAVT